MKRKRVRKKKLNNVITPNAIEESFEYLETFLTTDRKKKYNKYSADLFPAFAYILTKHFGVTIPILSRIFGVSEDTIYRWKRKYSDFDKALSEGIESFDTEVVEKTFLKTCLGYEYYEDTLEPEVEYYKVKNPITNRMITKARRTGKLILTERKVKHQPPNNKALQFWLTNRNPDKWKYQKNLQVDKNVNEKHIHELRLTVDEVKKLGFDKLIEMKQKLGEANAYEPVSS